jgi:hypothetical protein
MNYGQPAPPGRETMTSKEFDQLLATWDSAIQVEPPESETDRQRRLAQRHFRVLRELTAVWTFPRPTPPPEGPSHQS